MEEDATSSTTIDTGWFQLDGRRSCAPLCNGPDILPLLSSRSRIKTNRRPTGELSLLTTISNKEPLIKAPPSYPFV
jgi:hypothetical protein